MTLSQISARLIGTLTEIRPKYKTVHILPAPSPCHLTVSATYCPHSCSNEILTQTFNEIFYPELKICCPKIVHYFVDTITGKIFKGLRCFIFSGEKKSCTCMEYLFWQASPGIAFPPLNRFASLESVFTLSHSTLRE